jgi:VWFA-related protein
MKGHDMSWRVLALAFVVLLTTALAGQQARPPAAPSPDIQTTPTFKVQVEYVDVDVQVTDQQGNPVRDLKKEDFELLEDGKPQTISAYSFVDIPVEPSNRAVSPTSTSPLDPDVVTNERRFEGRVYVVVLDDLHIAPARTITTKNAMRRFIEQQFGANDLMTIVFTSGPVAPTPWFTSNKRLLLAAVDRFAGQALPSILENLNTPQPCGPSIGNCQPPRDLDNDERAVNGRKTMAGIRNVTEWLNGVRGRKKSVILLSEGFYYRTDEIMLDTASGGRRTAPGPIARTNVSIYAVDPRGLSTGGDDAIAFKEFKGDAAAEARALQTGLRTLAEQTGGFAAVEASNLGGVFERIVADNSRYYVLAYYPSNPRDDKFHRMTVRVRRPGVTVRSRRGYAWPQRDPSAARATTSAASSNPVEALRSPIPVSDIRMRLFAAPFRAGQAKASVLFGIELTGQDLPLGPDAKVEISYAALDSNGTSHGSQTERLSLNLEPATRARIEQSALRTLNRISLPPGPYQLRVAVHDPGRSVSGSIVYDMNVPDFDRLPLSMSGLLIMSIAGSRIVTAKIDDEAKALLPAPPSALRTFPQNDELGVFAEVYENSGGTAPAKVVISTTVRTAAGDIVFEEEEEPQSGGQQAGPRAYRHNARIPLSSLEPGAYLLSVEARSPLKADLKASSQLRFTVTPAVQPAR